MSRRNANEYARTKANQKQDMKVIGRQNEEMNHDSHDMTSRIQTLGSIQSAIEDRSELSRRRRPMDSFDLYLSFLT